MSFKEVGRVYIVSIDSEALLNMLFGLEKEKLKKIRLAFLSKDELKSPVALFEVGFRSMSAKEFMEEYFFKNIMKVLGTAETYFHAIVDVKSNSIYGFEALTRLSIPIHELFKMGDRITSFVDAFCREKALIEYRDRFYGPYKVFTNFHPKFLKNPLENAGDLVLSLSGKGLSPGSIVVEMDEYEGLDVYHIRLLRGLLNTEGIEVALDDVGSGYSGLYQLIEIMPNIAKLNMSLVRDIHKNTMKQKVVQGLVSACKEKGIKVLGEGVENREELEFLISVGVDLLQGFLFARPELYPKG